MVQEANVLFYAGMSKNPEFVKQVSSHFRKHDEIIVVSSNYNMDFPHFDGIIPDTISMCLISWFFRDASLGKDQ